MEYAKLEREIRLLKAYASGCTILALASLLGTALQAQNENERFTEIEVERINVVEADGRLALVIANSQRLPGPILRGEELDKSLSAGRTDSAGMIFVDPAGNEVGGLIHRTVIAADDAYTGRCIVVLPCPGKARSRLAPHTAGGTQSGDEVEGPSEVQNEVPR